MVKGGVNAPSAKTSEASLLHQQFKNTTQITALKRERCKRLFVDKASGASRKRPALDKCLKALEAGDVLIVWKLDRLGRSLRDLITLLDELKGQGAQFKSLTEAIDTETPTGRALWQMVGVLAELERSLIQERTKAGREAATRRGVKLGRKPKLSPQQVAHARKLIAQGERPTQVAHPTAWRGPVHTLRSAVRAGIPLPFC